MPWLIKLVGDVGDAIRGWADDADRSGIEGFVRRVRRSFNIWKGIVEELWGIVKEFFGDANDAGDELARHIRTILRRFREWLEENPDAIKQFFQDAAKFGKDLADAMVIVVDAFKWMVNAKDEIGEIFDKITGQGRHFDPGRWGRPPDFWPFQSGGAIPGTGTRRPHPDPRRTRRIHDPPLSGTGDRRPETEPAQRRPTSARSAAAAA